MIDAYLGILKDSLEKKLSVLQRIEEKSLEQTEMIKASEPDIDAIDQNMDEKLRLIEEINQLDDGFEALYQRIKEELENKKEHYKNEIKELQLLITRVTEKSSSIQAIEARNKSQIDTFLAGRKREIQHRKSAMSITRDYYQNMNKVKHVTPQFLDKKK